MPAPITTDLIWQTIEKRSFAILAWVNPRGEARTAGIVYVVRHRKLYVATSTESWKAKHIRSNPHVAINVNIPKRVPLMPWIQVPDATIAFRGVASVSGVRDADPSIVREVTRGMVDDPELFADTCIIEIEPRGHFAAYGVGVPLLAMRDPKKAMGRVAV